jgi:hypothetical protein
MPLIPPCPPYPQSPPSRANAFADNAMIAAPANIIFTDLFNALFMIVLHRWLNDVLCSTMPI